MTDTFQNLKAFLLKIALPFCIPFFLKDTRKSWVHIKLIMVFSIF